ncbi:MAG: lipopolysaccharide biosynthesis protein [Desulfuromonadales bacterium]|nr:lipopolysaccharide biosynthesis protein [Desulfuromonadales bacterium]
MDGQPHTNLTPEKCEEDEINLMELLRVIVRRKLLIIKICTVAIVLSVCYSLTLDNIYTATNRFLPPQKENTSSVFSALLSQAGGLAGLAGGGLGGTADLYLGILKSRSVFDAVIKRLDLQREFKNKTLDDTRRAVERVVTFKGGKDGIITVTADSKDPQKAALLANTFVDELTRRSIQLYLVKAGSEREFLEKRLVVVRQELKNAEDDLKSFQEKYKTIKVDTQATVAIEGIARLKAEIVSKEVQLAALSSSRTGESSDVKELQAGISKLKSQMGTLVGRGGVDNIIPATGNLPALSVEYLRKMRELKIQEAVFEQLTKQYEVAKINENKDSTTLQVLDEAVAPSKKSKPKRSLIVIFSTVTGFFISIVCIFIQEYLSKLSPEDAEIFREIKQSLKIRKRNA